MLFHFHRYRDWEIITVAFYRDGIHIYDVTRQRGTCVICKRKRVKNF